MQSLTTTLWVTTLLAGTLAGPAFQRADNICAGYCKDATKFQYPPGTVFEYKYTTDTLTSVDGVTTESTGLHLSATAKIQAVSSCELILKLHDVTLEESMSGSRSAVQTSSDFAAALQANPLRFALQDGRVEEVCGHNADPVWVLNIKRGVLSTLQNTMKDLESPYVGFETDINGHCETNYTLGGSGWSGKTITKSKDLLACSGRRSQLSAIQSTPYASDSPIQSLPLIRSQHNCEQTVYNNRIDKVTCQETHLFQPFSNKDSGAITRVTQKLAYSSEYQGDISSKDYATKRSSLLFEHEHDFSTSEGKEEAVLDVLKDLRSEVENGVRSDAPAMFSQLVFSLRSLSYSQLTRVYNKVKDTQSRKFLLDALPLLGTAESMGLVRDLFTAGEISGAELDLWLTSLAFQKNPTLAMISAVTPLVKTSPRPQALLGVSALVHTYCQRHENCGEASEVQDVILALEKLLGTSCRSRSEEEKSLVTLALKGLGNIGFLSQSEEVLHRCYQEENPIEVRLAAIDAFRRLSCEDVNRKPLLTAYQDMSQDSELRIAAYLAVMRCPSPKIIENVKNTLYSEAINQVGSFVWTHLTNLQETSSPSKQYVRELLENDFLRNKFNTDVRKFSRNFESSVYWQELNIGANVDSNVIFSSKSFLPRSAMANLTLDLFGESINLFEVGGRIEGFEQFLENFFGPNGYFPDDSINKMLQNIRNKRDADDNIIDNIASTFDVRGQREDEPQGSAYMRVFGNELLYASFRGLDSSVVSPSFIDNFNPIEILLQLFREQSVDYTKSFIFMDGSYIIPTAAGFPLNITVNGTATVGLKVNGKMDLSELWTKNSVDISGRIQPSAAVQVVGVMAVDAFVTKSGVMVDATMHTNTFLDGVIKVQGGELVQVKLNTPEEKIEILEVKSKLILLNGKTQRELQGITQDRDEFKGCSSETVSNIFGAKLCGELSYPNASNVDDAPYFPLTGPFSTKIYLEKTDAFRAYEFEYRWQNEQVQDKSIHTFDVSFDTPGSKINRQINALAILDEPNTSLKVKIETPFKKIDLSGKLENTDVLKGAELELLVDNNEIFSAKTALRESQTEKGGRFEQNLNVNVFQRSVIDVRGNVNYVPGSKYSGDLTISDIVEQPIAVSGNLNVNSKKVDVSAEIKSYIVDSTVKGFVKIGENSYSAKGSIDYSLYKSPYKTLSVDGKAQRLEKSTLTTYAANLNFEGASLPENGLGVSFNIQQSTGFLQTLGTFKLGSEEWELTQKFSTREVRNQQDIEMKFQVKCPARGINMLLDIGHQVTDTSLSNTITAYMNPDEALTTNIQYSQTYQPFRHAIALEAKLPSATEYKLKSDLSEAASGDYEASVKAQWGADKKEASFNGRYSDQSSRIQVQRGVEFEAILPNSEPIKSTGELKASTDGTFIKGELDLAGRRYSTDLSHKVQDGHIFQGRLTTPIASYSGEAVFTLLDDEQGISLDFDVGRRITLEAKVKSRSTETNFDFQFYWDRNVDSSKAMSVSAVFQQNRYFITAAYPGRTLQGEIVINANGFSGSLEWAPGHKIELITEYDISDLDSSLTVRLTSPFPGWEITKLNLNHHFDGLKFDTKINLQWNNENLELTLNGLRANSNAQNQTKANIALKSTLPSLRDISVSVDHIKNDRQYRSIASGTWNGKTTEAEVSWDNNSGPNAVNIAGGVSIQSDLPGLKSLAAKVSHVDMEKERNTYATLQWSADKKVEIEITGKNEGPSVYGELNIRTPFEGYETGSGNFRVEQKKSGFKLNADADLSGKKVTLELKTAIKSASIEVSGKLVNPFTEDLGLDFVHHQKRNSFNTDLKINYAGDRSLDFHGEGSVASVNNMEVSVTLLTPGHQFASKLQNLYDNEKGLDTNFEAVWDGQKTSISLSGTYEKDYQSRNIRYRIEALVPFVTLDVLKFSLEHLMRDNTYFTHVELVKGSESFDFNHDIKFDNRYNWENAVTMTGQGKKFTLTNKQLLKGNEMKHESEAVIDNEKATFIVNAKSSTNSGEKRYLLNSILSSPWSEEFKVDFEYAVDSTNIYKPSLVIEFAPGKKITVEGKFDLTNCLCDSYVKLTSPFFEPILVSCKCDLKENKFNSLTSFEYGYDKKIELNINSVYELDNISGDITFLTPFDVMKKTVISGKLITEGSERTGVASLTYGDNKKIALKYNGKCEGGKLQDSVRIDTPFNYYESISASYDLDLTKPTKVVVVSLVKNSDEIRLSGSASVSSSSGKVSLSLTTPINNWESTSVVGTFDKTGDNMEVKTTYEKNSQKIEFSGRLIHENGKGNVELSLRTPFANFESMSAQVEFDLSDNKKISIELQDSNNDPIRLDVENFADEIRGNSQLKFTSPFENYRNLGVQTNYDTTRKIASIILLKDGQRMEAQASLDIVDPNVGRASLSLKTPIRNYETVVIEGNYDFTKTPRSVAFSLAKNSDKIEANAVLFVKNTWKAHGSIDISTPFSNYESLNVGFKYDLNKDEKIITAFVDTKSSRSELIISGLFDGLKSRGRLQLTSPIEGLENIVGDIEYDFSGKQKTASFIVENNGVRNAFTIKGSVEENEASLKIVTPFRGFEVLTLSGFYETNNSQKRVSLVMEKNEDRVEINASGVFGYLVSEVQLQLKTPFTSWNSVDVNGRFDNSEKEKVIAFNASKDNVEFGLSLGGFYKNNNAEMKVVLNTPLYGYENVAVSGLYDFSSDYVVRVTLDVNGERKTVSGEFGVEDESAHLRMKTPFTGMEDVSVNGKYEDGLNDKVAVMTFEKNGERKDFSVGISFEKSSAKIHVSTPFEGYEEIALSGRYELTSSKNNVDLSLMYNGKQNEISTSWVFGSQSAEVELKTHTTVYGDEKISFTGQYTLSDVKKISFTATRNGEQIKFESTYTLDARRGEGEIRISTPFEGLENVYVSGNYRKTANQRSVNLITELNGIRKEISGTIEITGNNHLRIDLKTPFELLETLLFDGRYETNSVEVTLKSQFPGLEDVALSGRYDITSSNKKTAWFSFKNKNGITEGSGSVEYFGNFADISFELTTPVMNFKRIYVATKYDFSSAKKIASLVLEKDQLVYKFEGEFLANDVSAELSLMISSPISNFENMKIKGSYDFARVEKEIKTYIESNENKIVDATLRVTLSALEGKFELKALTPLSGLIDLDVNGNYLINNDYTSGEAGLKGGDTEYEASYNIQGTQGQFLVRVNRIDNIELNWQLEDSVTEKKVKLSYQLSDSQKTELLAQLKNQGVSKVDAVVSFTSSYSQTRVGKIQWDTKNNKFGGKIGYESAEGSLNLEGNMKYSTKHAYMDVSLQSPFKNFEDVSFQAKLNFKKEVNIESVFQWTSTDKVQLTANLNAEDLKSRGKITFISPLTESFEMNFAYDFTQSEKTIEAIYQYGKDRVQLTGNIIPNDYRNSEINLTLSSPFSGFTSMILRGKYDISSTSNKEATLVLEKEEDKVDFGLNMKSLQNGLDISTHLTSPFAEFENINFFITYDTTTSTEGTIGVRWGYGKEVKATLSWVPTNMRLQVTSPFWNPVVITYDVNMNGNEKYVYISSDFSGSKFDIRGTITVNTDKTGFTLTVSSSLFEELSVSGLYESGPEHALRLTVAKGDFRTEVNGNVVIRSDYTNVDVSFTSPLEGYDALSFRAGYDVTNIEKEAFATLSWGFNTIKLSAHGKLDSNQLTGNLRLTTPFKGFEALGLNAEMNAKNIEKTGLLSVEWADYSKIELQGFSTFRNGNGNTKFSLSTPFEGLSDISFSSKFSTNYVDLGLDVNGEKIELSGAYELNHPVYSINGTIRTPYEQLKNLELNTYVDLESSVASTTFQWSINQRVEVALSLRPSDLLILIETPYVNVRNVKVSGQYSHQPTEYGLFTNAQWDSYKIALKGSLRSEPSNYGITGGLEWENKNIELDASFKSSGLNSIESTFKLATPFENFKAMNMEFGFKNDGSAIHSTLNVNTPFASLPTLSSTLAFQYVDNKQMEGKLVASAQDKTISVSALVFNDNFKKIRTQLNVQLPFDEFDRISVEGKVDIRELNNANADLQVVLPTSTYKGGVSYTIAQDEIDLVFDIDTPTLIKKVSVGGRFTNDNFKSIQVSGRLNEAALSFAYSLDTTSLTFEISNNIILEELLNCRGEANFNFPNSLDATLTFFNKLNPSTYTVGYSFEPNQRKLNARIEIDSSYLRLRKSYSLTAQVPSTKTSGYSFDLVLNGEATHVFSVSAVRSEEEADVFVISGKIESEFVTRRELYVLYDEDWEKGVFSITSDDVTHKVSFNFDSEKDKIITLNAESPLLKNGKISITGSYTNNFQEIITSLTCQTGFTSHSWTASLTTSNDKMGIKVSLDSPRFSVFNVEGNLYRGERKEADLLVKVAGEEHKISGRLNTSPYYGELSIDSPLLASNTFRAEIKLQNQGLRRTEGEFVISVPEKIFQVACTFDSNGPLDYEGSLIVNTPFVEWNSLRMNGAFRFSDDLYADFSATSSSPSLPNVGVVLKVENSGRNLETTVKIRTPIAKYDNMEFQLIIPRMFTPEDLKIQLSTPFGEYSASGSFVVFKKNLELRAAAEWNNSKVDMIVRAKYEDSYELYLEVNTPFRGYEHLEWDLKSKANFKSWGEAGAFLEWNGQKVEIGTELRIEPNAYTSIIQLSTPFMGYDRYALSLRYEDTERKTIQVEIEYPNQRMGVEFDYVFNNWVDLVCKAKMYTPFEAFEAFSVQIVNQALESGYTGSIEGRISDNQFGVNVNVVGDRVTPKALVELKTNDWAITLTGNSYISPEKVNVDLLISTPYETLRSGKIFLELSPSSSEGKIGVTQNNIDLFTISLLSNGGAKVVELYTPFRAVSLTYSFGITSMSEIKAEGDFCWDMNNRLESRVGFQFSSKPTGNGKDINVRFTIPTREISLESKWTSILDNTFTLSWEQGQALGYKFMLKDESDGSVSKYDAIVRVNVPFRSFEIDAHHLTASGETKTDGTFKWDALNDKSKNVGFRYINTDLSSWGKTSRRIELGLIHSALDSEILLRLEYAQKPEKSFNGKIEIQYSPFSQNHIILETSYEDKSSRGNEKYDSFFKIQHSASNLDWQVNLEMPSNQKETSWSTNVSYLDRNGQRRFTEAWWRIMHLKGEVEVGIKTAENSLALRGSVKETNDGSLVAKIATQVNEKDPVSLETKLNSINPSAELNIDVGSVKSVNLFAGMPNNKEFLVKATHNYYGQETIDGMVALKLNSTRLLSSRAYWRTDALASLKNIISEQYDNIYHVTRAIVESTGTFVNQESADKISLFIPTVDETLKTIASYSRREFRAVQNDFKGVTRVFRRMYRNNDFYFRDIATALSSYLDSADQSVVSAVNQLSTVFAGVSQVTVNVYNGVLSVLPGWSDVADEETVAKLTALRDQTVESILDIIRRTIVIRDSMIVYHRQISDTIRSQYGSLESLAMAKLDEVEYELDQLLQQYIDGVRPYYQSVVERIEIINKQIETAKDAVNSYSEYITNQAMEIEWIRQILVVYKNYASWMEEFHAQDYLDSLKGEFNGVIDLVTEKGKVVLATYEPYITAVKEATGGNLDLLLQYPGMGYLNNAANRIYQKTAWLWRYTEMEQKLRSSLQMALRQVDKLVEDFLAEDNDPWDIDMSNNLVYLPEMGRIEYEQKLPVDWVSFTELPKFEQLPIYESSLEMKNEVDNYDFAQFWYSVLDGLHTYKPDLSSWVPPFGTHAMLAGNQHYMTFDKTFYEFAGECSYLLAGDFLNQKFSVVVNYEGRDGQVVKKSISIASEDKRIDVDVHNYKVAIDGQRVELPIEVGSTSLLREGHRIIIHNKNGLTIDCNLYQDVCTVDMSGWYFGKTGGLFGTYDNEGQNDLMTPSREIKTDVDSFAHSWKIGTSRCRVKNFARDVASVDPYSQQLCEALFLDSESPLRPCFAHVDAENFMKMCVIDVQEKFNTANQNLAVCSSAAAYVTECKKAGFFDLYVPSECVRCELDNRFIFGSGEEKEFNGDAPQSADVVFLVEQRECLNKFDLSYIPTAIESALKQKGIENNQYSVVGFGGNGIFSEPHVHTADNQIWSTSQKAKKSLSNVQFNSEVKTSDVHDAIWYVARMGYRPGVSKTIVLVTCSDCLERNNYADTLSALVEYDFTLHILTPTDLRLKHSKRAADEAKIYGIAREGAYTKRNVNSKLQSDKALLRQIAIPKDFCTPLALESNGSVFNINRMVSKKQSVTKKFIDLFASRVALTAKPTECQKCDCVADKDSVGAFICQPCEIPSIEQFNKEWEELLVSGLADLENYDSFEDSPEGGMRRSRAVPRSAK